MLPVAPVGLGEVVEKFDHPDVDDPPDHLFAVKALADPTDRGMERGLSPISRKQAPSRASTVTFISCASGDTPPAALASAPSETLVGLVGRSRGYFTSHHFPGRNVPSIRMLSCLGAQ